MAVAGVAIVSLIAADKKGSMLPVSHTFRMTLSTTFDTF
jgi:hypothetical protein